MRHTTDRCTDSYSLSSEDTNSYNPSWDGRANYSGSYDSLDTRHAAFHYRSEEQLKTLPYWGESGFYSGGGYVANLGNTHSDAVSIVSYLNTTSWIDQFTKVIFVEFNIWNANTNLFNSIIIVFDFKSTGLVFASHQIDVIVLYRYTGADGLLNLLSEVVLLIFMIVKTVLEVIKIVKSRGQHLKSLANSSMLVVGVLYFTAFGVYVWRSVLTASSVTEMMNNRGTCGALC